MTNEPATVLAALNAPSVTRGVLMGALALGEMTSSGVEAVHVVDGSTEAVESLAAHTGIPLRHLSGPAGPALLEATEAPGVFGTVLGLRERQGTTRSVGSVTRYLLERTTKPIVIVPPHTEPPALFRRLLAPLEGTDTSSEPVLRVLGPLLGADFELVVLHVFTEDTLPRMLDRPHRDLELLGQEFLVHHCPAAGYIEMRAGPVAAMVGEVSYQHRSQLIVLSWHQKPASGRAKVLRGVLEASALPVMVLPASDQARRTARGHRARLGDHGP